MCPDSNYNRFMQSPRVTEGISYQELDGELVIFDRTKHKVFNLNRIASLIFFFCDGEHTSKDILSELMQIFKDVEPAVLEEDLEKTLKILKKNGIVS